MMPRQPVTQRSSQPGGKDDPNTRRSKALSLSPPFRPEMPSFALPRRPSSATFFLAAVSRSDPVPAEISSVSATEDPLPHHLFDAVERPPDGNPCLNSSELESAFAMFALRAIIGRPGLGPGLALCGDFDIVVLASPVMKRSSNFRAAIDGV